MILGLHSIPDLFLRSWKGQTGWRRWWRKVRLVFFTTRSCQCSSHPCNHRLEQPTGEQGEVRRAQVEGWALSFSHLCWVRLIICPFLSHSGFKMKSWVWLKELMWICCTFYAYVNKTVIFTSSLRPPALEEDVLHWGRECVPADARGSQCMEVKKRQCVGITLSHLICTVGEGFPQSTRFPKVLDVGDVFTYSLRQILQVALFVCHQLYSYTCSAAAAHEPAVFWIWQWFSFFQGLTLRLWELGLLQNTGEVLANNGLTGGHSYVPRT